VSAEPASAPRRAARRLLTPNARFLLQTQVNQWRTSGPAHWLRWNAMLTNAWLRDRMNRAAYTAVSETALVAARRSDTVFIFGSGASLNDLVAEEWREFSRHDVFGFNAFYHQQWVDADFHLLRVGVYGDLRWESFTREAAAVIRSNPRFSRTVFILQEGYLAQFSNQLVGYRLLPASARIFRYPSAREDGRPTRSFADGLRHTTGTLADAVNCAFCAGWKRIVLVGVDLYDSRYFYLKADETVGFDAATGRITAGERNYWRGQRYDEPHATIRNGVVDLMADWRTALGEAGVDLLVYNPRSLLAEVLPVYHRSAGRQAIS
jgi:hypothetical protein